jgi:hypothetical protein
VDQVHVSVDRPGTLDPPAGVQQREERTGNSIRASLGLERLRGGRATMVRGSVVSALGERKAGARRKGNVSGERCGEL